MRRVRDDAIAIDLAGIDLPAIALWNDRLQRGSKAGVDRLESRRQRIVDDEPIDGMIDDRAHADVEDASAATETGNAVAMSIVASDDGTFDDVATLGSFKIRITRNAASSPGASAERDTCRARCSAPYYLRR